MKPLNGMNEFEYVKLAVETGCQFCNKHKTRKVCWEFTVRACKDCISSRTVSLYYIRTHIIKYQQNVEDIVSGLPFIQGWFYRPWFPHSTRFISLYWKDDVIRTNHEYLEMIKDPSQSKSEWFRKKKNEGKEKMLEIARRNSDYNTAFLDKQKENDKLRQERSSKIREKITEFTKETDVNGNQIIDLKILQDCPTYRSSLYGDKPQSPRPFTERAWKIMKNKLLKEYNELHNEKKKQAKKVKR
nr:13860_t:CDS:2 [Entrophospora candida]